jgi:hypothetical protein
MKDLVKYYKYLSRKAKNEGNSDLSCWWDLADVDNMKFISDEFLLLAWFPQRASTCKTHPILSPVDVLWKTTYDYFAKPATPPFFKRTARLAFDVEAILKNIHQK